MPKVHGNAFTLDQMITLAVEYGMLEQKGKEGQTKYDLTIVEATMAGAFDLAKDKHGKGVDDAMQLGMAWVKGRDAAVVFDHRTTSARKLCSNFRTFIKVGLLRGFGEEEPLATIRDLMTVHQALRAKAKGVKIRGVAIEFDDELGKLDDTHNTLLRFARAQLASDELIGGEALVSFCIRPDGKPRSTEDWLRAVIKQATDVQQGALSNCPELDNSPEVKAIVTQASKRLNSILRAKGDNE